MSAKTAKTRLVFSVEQSGEPLLTHNAAHLVESRALSRMAEISSGSRGTRMPGGIFRLILSSKALLVVFFLLYLGCQVNAINLLVGWKISCNLRTTVTGLNI